MAKVKQDLSTADLMELFGVGMMTIYNWRVRDKRKSVLPFHTRPRGTNRHEVYFKRTEVLKWAKENSVPLSEVESTPNKTSTVNSSGVL